MKSNHRESRKELPEAVRMELIWRTASAVSALQAGRPVGRPLLAELAQPVSDGPHAIRLQALWQTIGQDLAVNEQEICAALILLLLQTLVRATVEEGWCPHCQPDAAVLASHLRLAQLRTWQLAAHWAADCVPAADVERVRGSLQALRHRLYLTPHGHETLRLPWHAEGGPLFPAEAGGVFGE
jgi:hypothetical protein